MLVFLCVTILYVVPDVQSHTCCGPKLYQATILSKLGQYDRQQDKTKIESNIVKYYYDYNNTRVASTRNYTVEPSETVINEHIITDFNKGRMWIIRNRNCTVVNVTGSVTENCVPDGADFLGTHKYASVPVDVYTYTIDDGGVKRSFRNSFTQKDCIIVSETLLTNGPVFSLISNFYQNVTNYVPGNVFDVPDFCPNL